MDDRAGVNHSRTTDRDIHAININNRAFTREARLSSDGVYIRDAQLFFYFSFVEDAQLPPALYSTQPTNHTSCWLSYILGVVMTRLGSRRNRTDVDTYDGNDRVSVTADDPEGQKTDREGESTIYLSLFFRVRRATSERPPHLSTSVRWAYALRQAHLVHAGVHRLAIAGASRSDCNTVLSLSCSDSIIVQFDSRSATIKSLVSDSMKRSRRYVSSSTTSLWRTDHLEFSLRRSLRCSICQSESRFLMLGHPA